MIAIIDTGGNYGSLLSAFEKLGLFAEVTDVIKASHRAVVLPGVGRADVAMGRLRMMGLDRIIPNLSMPVLGICCGFHVLCESSEEGPTQCLGIFPLGVAKMPRPHHGWVETPNGWMFVTHGYEVRDSPEMPPILGFCQQNFTGVQFHPEKSGTAGLEFLRQWSAAFSS